MTTEEARLVELFDQIRREHQPELTATSDAWECWGCGDRLTITRDDDGQPLFNPLIRHHHEKQAEAVADRVEQAKAEVLAPVLALINAPYGSQQWGYLRDGVRQIALPDLLAALHASRFRPAAPSEGGES